uniref:Ras-related C3 botulinum toxin substrate 1 n=1 Tax=Macrostomum lignano TaxID=282301 RepID=A0A1I8JGM8_9PLAT
MMQPMMSPPSAAGQACPRIKCVVVGDGGAGKTCLLSTYSRGVFPTDYVPTVFDNYDTVARVDGVPVQLGLWDTAGQEDYDKLRPLSYPQTDVFIVCFSIGNRTSFSNVADKWQPELQSHSPGTPILLVGTKCDLRDDPDFANHLRLHNQRAVTKQEANAVATSVGAIKYTECSALRGVNIDQVFDDAIRCVLWPELFPVARQGKRGKGSKKSSSKKKSCSIQ